MVLEVPRQVVLEELAQETVEFRVEAPQKTVVVAVVVPHQV